MQTVKINTVKSNPDNPRLIKDDKFKKLVKSLQEFPEMANVRPIVVNGDMVVLGGNMRLKAMQEAGWKDVPIEVVYWSEEKQREFIIKDNVSFGENDWDVLANEWDAEYLESCGLDVPTMHALNGEYTTKVESPIYTPKTEKPNPSDLIDVSKRDELIKEIEASNIPEADKEILRMAAQRHVVFHYGMIAEYYAHADKDVQDLMENSAMVIIDYDKAIEKGFVKLTQTFAELMETDE